MPNGPQPGSGSSTSSNTTNQLLTDIMNEQIVLGFLMNHLKNYRDDLPSDFKLVLGANHDLASRIYLYLNNFYDGVSPSILHVIDLIHLYSAHPEMSMLTPMQIEHILIFEPELSDAISNFLNNSNLNNNIALLAVEGVLVTQMCVNSQNPGVCSPTNLPNSFQLIYNFYEDNGNGIFVGVTGNALTSLQKEVFTYLLLHPSLSALQKEAVVAYIQLYTSGNIAPGHGTYNIVNYLQIHSNNNADFAELIDTAFLGFLASKYGMTLVPYTDDPSQVVEITSFADLEDEMSELAELADNPQQLPDGGTISQIGGTDSSGIPIGNVEISFDVEAAIQILAPQLIFGFAYSGSPADFSINEHSVGYHALLGLASYEETPDSFNTDTSQAEEFGIATAFVRGKYVSIGIKTSHTSNLRFEKSKNLYFELIFNSWNGEWLSDDNDRMNSAYWGTW